MFMQTDNLKRASEDLVDCRTQLTLMTWICQCSMTNTSQKYERTQQGNLLGYLAHLMLQISRESDLDFPDRTPLPPV